MVLATRFTAVTALLGGGAVYGGAFVLNPGGGGHVIAHRTCLAGREALSRSSTPSPACRSRRPLRSLALNSEKHEVNPPQQVWDSVKKPQGMAAVAAAVAVAAAAAAVFTYPNAAAAAGAAGEAVRTAAAGAAPLPLDVSQLLADPLGSLAANPEWTRYAFMLPVGVVVATCAQTAGIGGAAIMGPFLLLVLPLLGPAYPLHSVAASVATAIMCEAFGFSSGLLGYFRRGLIDPGSARPFILASLPSCLLGALIVPYADERALKALYAVFMLGLSGYLLFDEQGSESLVPEECSVEELESGEIMAICTPEGKEYVYRKPDFGTDSGFSTAFGGLLTGMLGVGIGEVVVPQLVKKNGVPVPVAAGTSVLVVFLNAVVAAGTQVAGLVSQGGDDIPWNLIAFLVPGVVIGGQLAPSLQGTLSQRTMEKILSGVFGMVGATFAVVSVQTLLAATSVSASVP